MLTTAISYCLQIQKEKRADWAPSANTLHSVSTGSPAHLYNLFSFISLVMPAFHQDAHSSVPHTPCSRLCLRVSFLHRISSRSTLIWSNPTLHSFIYLNVKAQCNCYLFQEAFLDALSWSSLPLRWIPIATYLFHSYNTDHSLFDLFVCLKPSSHHFFKQDLKELNSLREEEDNLSEINSLNKK